MIQSEETRNEAYVNLGDTGALGKLQKEVLKGIAKKGPITDQELSEYLDLPLATINGRRRELFDIALVKPAGKQFNKETNTNRTLWVIHDGSKIFEKPNCASVPEMNKVHKIILKANNFQKNQILNWLRDVKF